jgi:gliding motility-associated-like protein
MNFRLKAIILISFFTLISTCINAQNLIPNGDFEEYTELPDSYAQINRAIGWNNSSASITNSGTPDFCHENGFTFSFSILPFSGLGQAGIAIYKNDTVNSNFREYISTKLLKPLFAGNKYRISFYASNGQYSTLNALCSNGLAVAFSTHQLLQENLNPIPYSPQVEYLNILFAYNQWKPISYVFTADDNFEFITIGNFRYDNETQISYNQLSFAYYFIDKIELVEMNYNICIGDSIELEHFSRDSSYAWALAESPNEILSTDKTLKVSPTISTTYLLFTGVDTISFPVIILYPLQSVLEYQQPICQGKPLLLNAGNSGASFLWQDQSTNSTFQVTQPGIYYVDISNACGTITDTVRVDTNCVAFLEMPNVFTPNGDGINDLFIPIKTQQIKNLAFSIYNRWGNQIAEIKPNMIGWDGKNGEESCPEGVYFWLAIYSDKSGMQYSQKGFVQLIR